jgi:hypothetical protein
MDKMRADFEAWVLTKGVFNDSGLTRSERSGEYHRAPLQLMYEAWTAALASSATTEPVNGEFKQKLNKLIQDCTDLAFDCGEFGKITPSTVDAYEKIVSASEAADQALRDFVIGAVSGAMSAAALAKQVPAQEQDKIDAARWRAFLGSARIRPLGSVGLERPEPNNYAHMGLEIWTVYGRNYSEDLLRKMDDGNERGRRWLTKYADVARAAQLAQSADTAEE